MTDYIRGFYIDKALGGLTPTQPPQNGAGQFPGTPLKHDQRPVGDAALSLCCLVHSVPADDS